MILYGAILSPFVRKVLAVAAEKGVALDMTPGGFGQGGEAFAEASPFHKMPALRVPGGNDDGSDYLLSDSSAIIAYIDAAYPDTPMIPAEPKARGRVIWYDEFVDTILFAAGAKMFFNRVVAPKFLQREGDLVAAEEAEKVELPKLLDWLDGQIGDRDFLVGDSVTLADISVAVVFANLRGAGFVLDAARHPNVSRWVATMEARPSMAAMTQKMDAILAKLMAA